MIVLLFIVVIFQNNSIAMVESRQVQSLFAPVAWSLDVLMSFFICADGTPQMTRKQRLLERGSFNFFNAFLERVADNKLV